MTFVEKCRKEQEVDFEFFEKSKIQSNTEELENCRSSYSVARIMKYHYLISCYGYKNSEYCSCNLRFNLKNCYYIFIVFGLIIGLFADTALAEHIRQRPNLDKSRFNSLNLQGHTGDRRSYRSSNISKDESSVFTSWSDWSLCDRYCTQNRVKRCRVKSKCGNAVMREERNCDHEGKGAKCKHNQRRANRHRGPRFHIVQSPKEAKPLNHRQRRNKKILDVLINSHFGEWSKWSPCTRSCTTQRFRWCKTPNFCEHEVLRESAYCYTESSFCQKWVRRKIGLTFDDHNNDLFIDEYELNGNENLTLNEGSNLKCGVSKKNSKLSYFTRIIGGHPAIPGAWPWQVAILNRYGEAFCGGTLVAPRWVLTAAHCVRKRLAVRIGEYNLLVNEGTEADLRVLYSVIHPKYNSHTVDNDIALLRLQSSLVPTDSLGIACLPSPKQQLPTDQLCTIIGWGKSNASHEFGTDVLHEAKIPIVTDDMCKNVYVDYEITNNMFCAGYHRGRMDSCAGDSGGPLLCKDPNKTDHPWTIFGITSFGEGCGKKGKYGIYARLSNYVNWISKVIKKAKNNYNQIGKDIYTH